MEEFETLLARHRGAVERFVRYRIGGRDAEDVLQEIFFAASRNYGRLQYQEAFKGWLLGIARRKCADYFRARAAAMEIPMDALAVRELAVGSRGVTEIPGVRETLDALGDRDRQMLFLYYFRQMPQQEIARMLDIPPGTVKSRLFAARERFRQRYAQENEKGECLMKTLPDTMPAYTIRPSEAPPFPVRHEELPGMFIRPKIGEKLTFGMYDLPARKLTGIYRLEATGEVMLHGVRGVEIASTYTEGKTEMRSVLFAQLTDTHCRYLGGERVDGNGVRHIDTFLDDGFSEAYGIGPDNCGFPVERRVEGRITEKDDALQTDAAGDVSDIVGRYEVRLGNQTYDTVRLVDFQDTAQGGMLCEYYLTADGRTALWRRFNEDTWAMARYGRPWTEALPFSERLILNGKTFVHWYDCITDRV